MTSITVNNPIKIKAKETNDLKYKSSLTNVILRKVYNENVITRYNDGHPEK